MSVHLEENKRERISEINNFVEMKAIERNNADLLIKLINNAETIDEVVSIFQLGTAYRNTGFYYDIRLEAKNDNTIRYFKKNTQLSFIDEKNSKANTHKLIIGDNYEALLNSLIEYKGKIDVIYIDPPYGKDSMGQFAQTNYNNSITRDNLLSMLHPRLILAKMLLRSGGVIFSSIDDKNYAYLKCLFDEVFSENNFIASYLWKKTDTPPSLSNKVRKKYEYVLCYGKNVRTSHQFSQGSIDGGDAPLLNAGNPEKEVIFPKGSIHFNIPDGEYKQSDSMKIKLIDTVVVKDGVNDNEFRAVGNWKWAKDTIIEEVNNGTHFLVKSEKFSIRYQRINISSVKIPQNNLDSELSVGTNEDGEKELKEIFVNKVFDNPKPVSLIKFLINMVNLDNDITVLDFFAGSGTTGQAVLELNKEDGGNRKFILVQYPEDLDVNSKDVVVQNGIKLLNKLNLPLKISSITNERLRRVMTGHAFDGAKDFDYAINKQALGDSLDVYDMCKVANFEVQKGLTAFDVIDETLYGQEKFKTLKEKITWICNNFDKTQEHLTCIGGQDAPRS